MLLIANPDIQEALFSTGIYFMVFLFGITIGSFLNVCIYRLPKGESIVKNNSHCMSCGVPIKRYDLIPVLSWLILKGKCRSCKAAVSPRYIIVELLTGALFTLIFISHDLISDGFIYPACLCLFTAGLIVVGFEDFDTKEMSVSILIYLGVIAIITRFMTEVSPRLLRSHDTVPLKDGLIGMAAISVPFLIIGFVITPLVYVLFISDEHKSVRKIKKRMNKMKPGHKEYKKLEKELNLLKTSIKENGSVFGFGMGDIILMAAGGLMLGWKAAITASVTAVILGAVYAVIIIIRKKKDENNGSFAFGPFLTVGLAFSVFFGTKLFDLYVNSLTLKS